MSRHDDAIASFDRAIEIDPNSTESWFRRGQTLEHLGNCKAAIASYDKALSLNPRSDKTWYNRGLVLSRLGEHEDAIACFDQAIALNPNLPDVHSRREASMKALEKN